MRFVLSNGEEFFLMFNVDIDEISQDTGIKELSEALHDVAETLVNTEPNDMGTIDEYLEDVKKGDSEYKDIMSNLMSK